MVTDPNETYIYDLVELSTEKRYKATLLKGDPEAIRLAQEYIYDVPTALQHEPWKEWLESKKYSASSLGVISANKTEESVEVSGAAVDAVETIIKEAISGRASDIHLETFEDGLTVRCRSRTGCCASSIIFRIRC